MKKLTKLLSVFIIAGAVGTGAAGVSACKSDKKDTHTHNYTYSANLDGKTHTAVCDGCDEMITDELHVDEDENKECDLCKADLSQKPTTPPDDGKDDEKDKDSVTKVEISGSKQVAVKSKITLTATVTVTGNAAKTVTWSTSDETKATVSATGEVTGVAEGTVTITATSTVDKTKKADYTITVVAEGTVIKPDPGEDPGTEKTIYETLIERTDKLTVLDSTYEEGSKLDTLADYYTKGIYFRAQAGTALPTDSTRDYVEVIKDGEALALKQHGSNGSTTGIPNVYTEIVTGPVSGTVEGYFETKISALTSGNSGDSGQNPIVFLNNGNAVLTVNAIAGKLSYKVGNGELTEISGKTLVKDTYIKVYFVFDLENGKTTLKLDDVTVLDEADTGITSIDCIELASSNKGARQQTTKNIVVCGTEMAIDSFKEIATANLDSAYAKYKLEDTEDEEGNTVLAEYSINKALVTKAYNDGKAAITAATTIEDVNAAYSTAIAAMRAVLSDAQIDTAREAAIMALEQKLPSDNYSYDFASDSEDKIYNNKSTYDIEIEAIKTQINAATTQDALDALVENATISVGDNAAQLAAKKTAAKAALNAYRADEIAALETDHATHYNNIMAEDGIIKTALADIDSETTKTIQAVNAVLEEAKADIDSEIQATQETLEQTIARYQGYLENDGTTAKTGVTDQAKLDAVDTAVTAGKSVLAGATKENISRTYDTEKAKVQMVIPKLDAKAALSASSTAALAEIQGTSTAATTATTAVNKAVTDGNAAIDAATTASTLETKLGEAQTAITTAMNTLKATEFDVQVKLNNTNIGKNIKVKYGSTLTISDNQLNLTDRQMIDKLYEENGTTEHSTSTIYYNTVTLVVTVKAAYTVVPPAYTFSYAAIPAGEKVKDTPLTAADIAGQNSFLTLGSGAVNYRLSSEKDGNSKVNFVQVSGEAFKVTFDGAGTLVIGGRGTGGSANAAFAVVDENGNRCALASIPSGVTEYDDNVYSIASADHVDITFDITHAGTYSIIVLRNCANGDDDPVMKNGVQSSATFGMGRISKIEKHEASYKVECDVTVTFGDGEAQYYYHDEDIALPETDPTGNGEFVGWYYGETQFTGGKLPAGTYTMVAKFEYTVKVTYNDGTDNVDLYLNVANGSAIEAKLPTLPANGNQVHTGWALSNGGTKIDFSTITVGTAASPATVTLYPVYEESTATLVTEITVTAADNATSLGKGGTLQLSATTNADADDKTVTWTSSDTSIATVDENGLVTGVAEGEVTITATANDGSGVTATVTLTVTESGSIVLDVAKTVTSSTDVSGGTYLGNTDFFIAAGGGVTAGDGKLTLGGTVGVSGGNARRAIGINLKAGTYKVKVTFNCSSDRNIVVGYKDGTSWKALDTSSAYNGEGKEAELDVEIDSDMDIFIGANNNRVDILKIEITPV